MQFAFLGRRSSIDRRPTAAACDTSAGASWILHDSKIHLVRGLNSHVRPKARAQPSSQQYWARVDAEVARVIPFVTALGTPSGGLA